MIIFDKLHKNFTFLTCSRQMSLMGKRLQSDIQTGGEDEK